MKSIEVTEAQYEELDAIREALAEDVEYGHVRPRDALQCLLDARGDSGIDVAAVGNGTETDVGDDTGADDGTDESSAAGSADETADRDADEASAAEGEDKLSAMMNLLDTHDDKWEQADSEETRYVVDLPDGGTEEVQTKDDVKAILFKNY
jgi:hypothetical protein